MHSNDNSIVSIHPELRSIKKQLVCGVKHYDDHMKDACKRIPLDAPMSAIYSSFLAGITTMLTETLAGVTATLYVKSGMELDTEVMIEEVCRMAVGFLKETLELDVTSRTAMILREMEN